MNTTVGASAPPPAAFALGVGERAGHPHRFADVLRLRIVAISIAEIAFATALCALLRHAIPPPLLIGWWALVCVSAGVRLALGRAYARCERRDGRWRKRFMASLIADGVLWSALGTWLYPIGDDPSNGLVVVASLLCVTAAGAYSLALHTPSTLTYSALVLGPAAVFQAAQGTSIAWFTAFGMVLLMIVIWYESRALERHVQALLRRHLETDSIARERAQALAVAQRHSAAKSQFVAHMSHEVRTPLHGMLGLARLLQNSPLDATQRRWLEMMERSGEHLCALINDVLDVSRIQSGKLTLRCAVFDLDALINDVLTLHQASARMQGLVLQAEVDLPRPAPVRGDPTRVRQVLDNLIGNALKFTDEGQITVKVRRAHGAQVVMSVTDQGIGLSAQDIDRIFEAFQQADGSLGRRHGGTGLGLTIARALAQSMGGDVRCASQVGQGSTFCFTANLTPATADELVAAIAPHGRKSASTPTPSLEGCKVLVVEDNSVNAMLVEASLQALGLRVEVAGDGQQAVDMWRGGDFDLVLMDCQMPRMDGMEATRRIRKLERAEDRSPVTIVALTAQAGEEDWDRCRAAGMNDCLCKPFRAEQLNGLLHRYLGRRPARRQEPLERVA